MTDKTTQRQITLLEIEKTIKDHYLRTGDILSIIKSYRNIKEVGLKNKDVGTIITTYFLTALRLAAQTGRAVTLLGGLGRLQLLRVERRKKFKLNNWPFTDFFIYPMITGKTVSVRGNAYPMRLSVSLVTQASVFKNKMVLQNNNYKKLQSYNDNDDDVLL